MAVEDELEAIARWNSSNGTFGDSCVGSASRCVHAKHLVCRHATLYPPELCRNDGIRAQQLRFIGFYCSKRVQPTDPKGRLRVGRPGPPQDP
jgi:hypothetical protein